MKCFVSGCNSDFHGYKYEDDTGNEWISCHRMPKNPKRRIAWLDSIANAVKKGRRRLKDTAIPVIFDSVSQQTDDEDEYIGFEEVLIVLPGVKGKLSPQPRKTTTKLKQHKRTKDILSNMRDLLNKIASKGLLVDVTSTAWQQYSSNEALFEELRSRTNSHPCSETLRRFAAALHFDSPKAYSYVRKVFDNTLPHPRIIATWYQRPDGRPVYTKGTLDVPLTKTANTKAQENPFSETSDNV
ncbi:uncharacterized protein LOC129769287 isoform X2 [Toxorhynchites rutilus septentrionalis]|uniref:uncharacterized protein LOC129769287 isoform X2 n=1 Tax=Toxorhynchites rutilus septentrionalis TaxID=329112 RepID=UPI002478799F|nr:uncharacterized protein LOC129769287 isoform X2 [Toxorhynchites rutilus septentrionalis]